MKKIGNWFRVLWIFLVFVIQTLQAQDLHTVPGRSNKADQVKKPYVILISADGFRYDYIDKYDAPHLKQLRKAGVAAASMQSSFPSVTFPNHYTVVTGMYPAHHGLVYNEFFDRQRREGYAMGNRKAVEDGSWYGGIPLWVLAEQQGMVTASYHFVGTEAPIQGIFPTYWYTFSDKIALDQRIAQVVDWLRLPEAVRPHLITFYMSHTDHAGHYYGPDSEQTREAVKEVDAAVGKMNEELAKLGLPVNFVFLSDHGMALVDTVYRMDPVAGIDTSRFIVKGGSTMIQLYAKNAEAIIPEYSKLKQKAVNYQVYLKKELPAAWHFGTADDYFNRIGDIVLVANYPKVFSSGNRRILPGTHGFDPAIQEMQASFMAWGPAFRKGTTIGRFENVHVYPLICKILGLKFTHQIDGRLDVLRPMLR